MSEARLPLRKVCVVGGGQVGVLAAIAIKRALPVCEVLVIGSDPAPSDFADHAASALPFTNKLHDRLGIAEADILTRAGGSHRLVLRYIGWGSAQGYGVMSYGAANDPGEASSFVREWGAGPRKASAPRSPGSIAEALADAGRFCIPPQDRESPLSQLDYALRWNPGAYHALLVAEARRLGVAYVRGAIGDIALDAQGMIAALGLAGHEAVQADLFLDCSGAQSHLLGVMPQHEWCEWDEYLPPRRILIAPAGKGMLALEDRVSLLREGWLAEFAGRDGLQVALGVAPGTTQQAAIAALGAQPMIDLEVKAGAARAPWIGNVVALGDAAARFEPLASLPLDLAHRMLALLLDLLPGRDIEALERDEFNRRARQMMEGVRDTLVLHQAAPAAQHLRGDRRLPKAAAQALDQFARRGRLPFVEEMPLCTGERFSLMRALGFSEGIPLQERSRGAAIASQAAAAFQAQARAALQFAPPYGEWMMQHIRPA